MAEREFEIEPYGVEMTCDVEGCDGVMERVGGIMLAVDPPRFQHLCNKCGAVTTFTEAYPTVKWRRKTC